ncbi:non-ribosomal peptide synthetase [Asaia bogorensis]|uniref:non-ribosomal peptide synthetase n=1 Tax=Asaia bogorensis TaxID=91915 RepID=UPI000EFC3A66|nr:non-ribosomal peptide synthetase [Asaia bogorensis]
MLQETRTETLPLTTAQRGLWMTQFLAPSGSSLNIAEAIHLRGELRTDLFIESLTCVQAEAETLRTAILRKPEGPVYAIRPQAPVDCPVIPFHDMSDQEQSARDWMLERLRAPLDLERDPLWQNALLRLTDTYHIWFHCCHHAVLDGFSGGMVAARVAAHYTARNAGISPPEATFLPLSTLHEQEQAYRKSPRFEKDKAYWSEALAEAPEPVSLSLRPQRAPSGEAGGAITRAAFMSDERAESLTRIGRALEATLPQTLTALLVAYLYRVTGQSDLVVGMPVSARANRQLRHTPGMVANAVALRFRITPETRFADLVGMARRAMRNALRHQQYRYEDMRRDLGLFSNTTQISRIGINIEPFDYNLSFGPITARNENLSNGAMEDLTIFVFDRKDGAGLCFQCDANPALYAAHELDAHLTRILRLAEQIANAPDITLAHLSLLTTDERDAQEARNRTTRRDWPTTPLSELIDNGVSSGSGPLVSDAYGVMTREVFLRQSRALAEQLRAEGMGPGKLIALALPRDRRMILAVAAVLQAGAAWLPLDIASPQARAKLILEDAEPSAVIVPDAAHLDWAAEYTAWALTSDASTLQVLSQGKTASSSPVPDDTAYVTYTSGTTGRPKGVVIPRKALTNFLHAITERLAYSARETLLAVTTWTFDIAVLEMLLPLVSGGACVIASREDILEPSRLAALIQKHDITAMQATPTLWQTLLGTAESSALQGMMLMSGGEAMPAHMARQMLLLGRAVHNLYGPTETTIWSTTHHLDPQENDTPAAGHALANTQIYIIAPDLTPLPDGVVGELLIAGDGVATGYLNQPELTASRFIPDPLGAPGRKAYRTGDRAAIEHDGTLTVFGRGDQQIKIRGMRIEPNEIESTLLSLPEILQAAVMIEKDPARGVSLLAAYLVPATHGARLDPAQIRRTLLGLLPPQMIPVRIVCIETLPRMTSGKLDRAALASLREETETTIFTEARTPAERRLSALWGELLDLERVDIHTSFFELGGDSLMVVQMIACLSREGYALPVGQVFAAPTIALMAPLLEGGSVTCDPLAPCLAIRAQGDAAPVFCFHPVIGMSWNFNTLAPLLSESHPVYGLQDAGLLLKDDAPATLAALAAFYVAELRRLQPHGPYHLVGWSMGGVVAHEIASLLRQEGEEIALLAMLDSYPCLLQDQNLDPDSPQAIRAALQFLQIAPVEDAALPETLDGLADLFLDTLDTTVLPDLPEIDLNALTSLAEKLRLITRRNIEMLLAHVPTPNDADILFLRAADKGSQNEVTIISDDPYAWRAYSSGHITAYDLDCRHGDMLLPGHVETVARLINVSLAQGHALASCLSAA